MMRVILLVLVFVVGISSVRADGYSLKDGRGTYGSGPEIDVYGTTTAHGCYFHRGRKYCSRYCYIEANGFRYCQRRLRDAYPQANFWVEDVYPRRSRW